MCCQQSCKVQTWLSIAKPWCNTRMQPFLREGAAPCCEMHRHDRKCSLCPCCTYKTIETESLVKCKPLQAAATTGQALPEQGGEPGPGLEDPFCIQKALCLPLSVLSSLQGRPQDSLLGRGALCKAPGARQVSSAAASVRGRHRRHCRHVLFQFLRRRHECAAAAPQSTQRLHAGAPAAVRHGAAPPPGCCVTARQASSAVIW